MKISIITSTLNSAATLGKLLDSVAAQTAVDNIEHIIVDARSTDNTIGIAANYPHVSKIYSCKDRGIYHAFNVGLENAVGDIVYFIGSDDYLVDDNVIKDVLSLFIDSGKLDYLFCRVRVLSEKRIHSWVAENTIDSFKNAHPNHQGFFCKKAIFDEVGPFNECFSIAADNYMMKKVMQNYVGLHSRRIVACFKEGGVSACDSNQQILEREFKSIGFLLNEKFESRDVVLSKNISDLKSFFLKAIYPDFLCKYKNKKVAIFGTRELSRIVSRVLSLSNAKVMFFITSVEPDDLTVDGISVYSILDESLKDTELDYVISCIEGTHENDVCNMIKSVYLDEKVISWRDL